MTISINAEKKYFKCFWHFKNNKSLIRERNIDKVDF